MYTLYVLVAVTAACAFARPPVPKPERQPLLPRSWAHDDSIMRQEQDRPSRYDDLIRMDLGQQYDMPEDYFVQDFPDPAGDAYQDYDLDLSEVFDDAEGRFLLDRILPAGQRYPGSPYIYSNPYHRLLGNIERVTRRPQPVINPPTMIKARYKPPSEVFAMTPSDIGYFDGDTSTLEMPLAVPQNPNATMDPRAPRQNPNLSRTKTLVASNLDKLRIGLSEEPGNSKGTDQPELVHVYDTKMADSGAGSMYNIALMSGLGAALALGVGGFLVGWYSLSKRAKAAADVDYPAYGVTGPSAELAGDRKLAHSAHMYHYQHQKQQIIAMERSCCDEQRNGSVSDPESEEDIPEGDYTVYECPGFATTGDMEVKNPMFTGDTPATPGKCEIVKPQPTD